jgi:GNAT superfamily N-acetyltransferase
MLEPRLRNMQNDDWSAVGELIHVSINCWNQMHALPPIFLGDPSATQVFCRVYQDLDPGCCLLAEHSATGRLMGSCFYHPRDTHVSVGIMNVHPAYFGRGVGASLLRAVIAVAERQEKPLRLISSALNLDSFSLYTRHGFVPRQTYQDMLLSVPDGGLDHRPPAQAARVRPGRVEDARAMADLEERVSGIRRENDYRYFLENREGIWHVSVCEGENGLDGFLCSVIDPAIHMLGPGVALTAEIALGVLHAELDRCRGRTPVFLVPVDQPQMVAELYRWGARNCELHLGQVRGSWQPMQGITMPTFLPETG